MNQRFFSDPTKNELPRTADVIVIGGGPAGAAAVWALERASPGIKTVLVERNEQLAAGTSAASLESYRTCWPALCLARLMARSIDVFHHANEYLGEGAAQALNLKEHGYLFCGFTVQQAEILQQEVQHLHKIGLSHIEFLNAGEIAYRYPWLAGRVIAAKYDPSAGWLDSHALIYRFVQSTQSTKILLGVQEARIVAEGSRVTGVTIPSGHIAAPNVVIAAGPRSREIGRTAGLELPIVIRPRQSFTTPWRHPEFPPNAPMLIGAAPFPHVRPEAQSGAIFGWEYNWNNKRMGVAGDTKGYLIDPVWPVEKGKDMRFPSMVLTLLAQQFHDEPGHGFANPRYLSGLDHRAGYYVYRDHTAAYVTDSRGTHPYESQRAIIDSWPGIDGLYLSVAHVGHGIMASPAGGEIIAAKVLRQSLPDPIFAQFGLAVPWVEYDSGGISAHEEPPA